MSLHDTPPRNGHALEFRIYAEDPKTFLPSPGSIERLELPGDARVDFGYDEGDQVPMYYDPLIGKVVVRGDDRAETLGTSSLDSLRIDGVKTNVPALADVLRDERFVSGNYDTGLLGR